MAITAQSVRQMWQAHVDTTKGKPAFDARDFSKLLAVTDELVKQAQDQMEAAFAARERDLKEGLAKYGSTQGPAVFLMAGPEPRRELVIDLRKLPSSWTESRDQLESAYKDPPRGFQVEFVASYPFKAVATGAQPMIDYGEAMILKF